MNTGAAKTPAAKKAAKNDKKTAEAKPKAPRKVSASGGLKPSDALAAVIGGEQVLRTQVIKKLWDYIKANNLARR